MKNLLSIAAFLSVILLQACGESTSRQASSQLDPGQDQISITKNSRPVCNGRVGDEILLVDRMAEDIISQAKEGRWPSEDGKIILSIVWEDELINAKQRLIMDARQRRIVDRYKMALSDHLIQSSLFKLINIERKAVRQIQEESANFAEKSIDMGKELSPGMLMDGKFTVFVYDDKLQLIVQAKVVNTKTQELRYGAEWICAMSRNAIPEFRDLTGNAESPAAGSRAIGTSDDGGAQRQALPTQREQAFIGRWSNGKTAIFDIRADGTWSTQNWPTIFGTWDTLNGSLRLTPTGPTKSPLTVQVFTPRHMMISRLNESWDLNILPHNGN